MNLAFLVTHALVSRLIVIILWKLSQYIIPFHYSDAFKLILLQIYKIGLEIDPKAQT